MGEGTGVGDGLGCTGEGVGARLEGTAGEGVGVGTAGEGAAGEGAAGVGAAGEGAAGEGAAGVGALAPGIGAGVPSLGLALGAKGERVTRNFGPPSGLTGAPSLGVSFRVGFGGVGVPLSDI